MLLGHNYATGALAAKGTIFDGGGHAFGVGSVAPMMQPVIQNVIQSHVAQESHQQQQQSSAVGDEGQQQQPQPSAPASWCSLLFFWALGAVTPVLATMFGTLKYCLVIMQGYWWLAKGLFCFDGRLLAIATIVCLLFTARARG